MKKVLEKKADVSDGTKKGAKIHTVFLILSIFSDVPSLSNLKHDPSFVYKTRLINGILRYILYN